MVQLKYSSKQIGNLGNIDSWGKALMVKVHVITGWALPTTEMMEIFIDQFTKKIIEDYSNLNIQEIEYAFRSTGTAVKDWGKSMNLSLIDEVLKPYVQQRFELSQQEERLKNKPVQKTYTLEEIENIQRGDIEAFYQRCLNGVIPPNELPPYFLPILIKDGHMSEDSNDLHAFFAYKINKGCKNLYKKIDYENTQIKNNSAIL